jgi:hypothetical protein
MCAEPDGLFGRRGSVSGRGRAAAVAANAAHARRPPLQTVLQFPQWRGWSADPRRRCHRPTGQGRSRSRSDPACRTVRACSHDRRPRNGPVRSAGSRTGRRRRFDPGRTRTRRPHRPGRPGSAARRRRSCPRRWPGSRRPVHPRRSARRSSVLRRNRASGRRRRRAVEAVRGLARVGRARRPGGERRRAAGRRRGAPKHPRTERRGALSRLDARAADWCRRRSDQAVPAGNPIVVR